MKRAILTAILLANSGAAYAAGHTIDQKGRRFHPGDITIARGDTITFTNNDDFIHQIYVDTPEFKLDTKERAPGENDTEAFTQAGTFEVHCHIHPKMKLVVTVK